MLKKGFHGFCMALAVLILSSLFESHIYVVSSLFIGFIAGSIPLILTDERPAFRQMRKGLPFGLIGILLAAVLLLRRKTRKTGEILAAALVVDVLLCNGLLKHLFHRVRPCDVNTAVSLLVSRPTDYSFPSGHTAASFAAVAALYLAGARRLWKPALVLGMLIAFSRLYLYVHYPSDILGGVLVGLFAGWVGSRIAAKLLKCSPALARMCAPERPDGKEGRK